MKIKDLPSEIQLLAALRTSHLLKKDIAYFMDIQLDCCFTFSDAKEGNNFWQEINKGNFAPFYERYPDQKPKKNPMSLCDKWDALRYSLERVDRARKAFKNAGIFPNESSISKESREALYKAVLEYNKKSENVYPKVMEVRDHGADEWDKRKVAFEYKGKFYAEGVEHKDDDELFCWTYARDIPQKTIITKQDIASKFGVDIDSLEIV